MHVTVYFHMGADIKLLLIFGYNAFLRRNDDEDTPVTVYGPTLLTIEI